MKYACIDVGTNSIRLLVADYENGRLSNRRKKLAMTRLGKGVNETKMLDHKNMVDSLNAIDEFHHEALTEGVQDVFIYATSAVRDAYNGIDFRQMVFNKTEIELEIISGNQEAALGFYGVELGFQSAPGWNQEEGPFMIVDIGGGSTEFIYGGNGKMHDAISIDIGAVRLMGMHIQNDPLTQAEIEAVRATVKSQLRTIKKLFGGLPIRRLVGIGGTVTTFTSIANNIDGYQPNLIHNSQMTASQVKEINQDIQSRTIEERKSIIGLEARRADIAPCGGLILEGIFEIFGMGEMLVSDYDNLEGYLLKKLHKSKEEL